MPRYRVIRPVRPPSTKTKFPFAIGRNLSSSLRDIAESSTPQVSKEISALPGPASPSRLGPQVVDLDISPNPVQAIKDFRFLKPPSPSPRAFPRLPVSSKSRAARTCPPTQASPRPCVKCPMCKKTVKKPMRLQQCPQVCIDI